MGFVRIEEPALEASGEIRFELRDALRGNDLVPFGHLFEASEVGAITRRRDDERAVDDGRRISLVPQRNTFAAEIANDWRRALSFAFGGNHRRRQATRAGGKRLAASLNKANTVARACVRKGLPESCDAGADNSYR